MENACLRDECNGISVFSRASANAAIPAGAMPVSNGGLQRTFALTFEGMYGKLRSPQ